MAEEEEQHQGDAVVTPAAAPRPPLRARINMALRRYRFKLAWRLVRGMDGAVVSRAALEAATLDLAKFPGWADELLNGQPRKAALITDKAERVTQFLMLAVEIGAPELQGADLQQLYLRLRAATLSRRQRERIGYEHAVRSLKPRKQSPVLCEHRRRVTPEGQNGKFRCLDCGIVRDVPQPAGVVA